MSFPMILSIPKRKRNLLLKYLSSGMQCCCNHFTFMWIDLSQLLWSVHTYNMSYNVLSFQLLLRFTPWALVGSSRWALAFMSSAMWAYYGRDMLRMCIYVVGYCKQGVVVAVQHLKSAMAFLILYLSLSTRHIILVWNTDGDPTQSQLHHDFDLVGSGLEDESFVMFGAGASDLGNLSSRDWPDMAQQQVLDVSHFSGWNPWCSALSDFCCAFSYFGTALIERFHSCDVLIE